MSRKKMVGTTYKYVWKKTLIHTEQIFESMFIIKIVYAEKLISWAFCFVNIYLHFFSDSKIRNEDYNNKKDKKD